MPLPLVGIGLGIAGRWALRTFICGAVVSLGLAVARNWNSEESAQESSEPRAANKPDHPTDL